MAEQYLVHYGVQGMKWGVRKKEEGGLGNTRGAHFIDRLRNEHAQTKAAKAREALDSTNYVKKRRAEYWKAKADYKSMKKSSSDKSAINASKQKMKDARRTYHAQQIIGTEQKLNSRYTGKGGQANALVDHFLSGNAASVNRQLNLGHSYVKSIGKATVGTFATSAAIGAGTQLMAPLMPLSMALLRGAARR